MTTWLKTIVATVLFVATPTSSAFEAYQVNPSTRAMGMAGVFAAQADDSSAIWYNPAGPKALDATHEDVTIELASIPTTDENGHYANSTAELKFVAGYSDQLVTVFNNKATMTIGAAYFSPLRARVFVDVPRNGVDNTPFGTIDVAQRQLSALVAVSPFSSAGLGATLDVAWSDTRCRDYDLCVKNGPRGEGASLGAIFPVTNQIDVAAAWRSRIKLKYASRPAAGLGSVLEDYVPGRPETFVLGTRLRIFLPLAAISLNSAVERVLWSDVTGHPTVPDYLKFGLSAESLIPLKNKDTFALRFGASRAHSSGTAPNVQLVAFGLGYAFLYDHSVDFSVERRSTEAGDAAILVSLSYSAQR